jgi:tetratricopeptide (TPR) repeat protein
VLAAAPALATTPGADIAEQAESSSATGNYLAGRTAAGLRDMEAAATFLRSALRASPKEPELLDRTFRIVLASGDFEQASNLAERVAAVDPNNRLARLTLAVRAMKARQYSAVRTQLAQSIRGPMPDVVAALVAAWAWEGSGDTARALKTADTLNGNDLIAVFRDLHAGLIAEAGGNLKEAEKRLAAAYKADQSLYVVVDAYARLLAHAGKRDEALKVYRDLAQSMTRNARLSESIAALEKGEKLEPMIDNPKDGAAEALFTFGQLASRGESAEIGLVYLNLALYLAPQHELGLLTLADLQETIGQHDQAIEVYKRIPRSSSFHEDVGLRVAVNLAQSDRMDEAEEKLRGLIAEDKNDVEAIVALGNLLHREKKYDDAAAVFTQAVEATAEPKKTDWSLFFARGVAYDAAKKWHLAEKDLEMAVKLDPDQAVALNYLGYSWVDRGTNYEHGMDLIKKAVELRPNDGDIVDSLGWAYYRLGKYPEATTELERAVELKPESWEINDHLGDVYWKTNRKLEAKFQWLHALTLEITDEKRKTIERKLTEGLEKVEAEVFAAKQAENSVPADRLKSAKP